MNRANGVLRKRAHTLKSGKKLPSEVFEISFHCRDLQIVNAKSPKCYAKSENIDAALSLEMQLINSSYAPIQFTSKCCQNGPCRKVLLLTPAFHITSAKISSPRGQHLAL